MRTRWPVMLILLMSLSWAAGRADNGASAGNGRHGSFYGGISGGGT
jgi:hypothetical protein